LRRPLETTVISGHSAEFGQRPLYPRKQTLKCKPLNFSKLRRTPNALLVRKLVGENVNPVNFRRFGKEVACLGFFHQSRRHFAI
jgi:hypothetical protein